MKVQINMIKNQKIELQIQNTTNRKSNMERKIEGQKDDQVQTNIKIINRETLVMIGAASCH